MNLWLGALISLACAALGVILGRWFSRLPAPYWTIGYFFPLSLVVLYGVGYHVPALMFTPPFSWMLIGLRKFAIFSFVCSMVLTTPLSRVTAKRTRIFITALMVVMVFLMGIYPFISPLVDRPQLSRLRTVMDTNNICMQSTDYTCGPAAAVTALRRMGFPAQEGEIAILSCTSSQEGTPEDMLADGLTRRYGGQGLTASCRAFKSVAELKGLGLTLAIVKYGFLVDHWVTVLEVTDSEVTVGDPLNGLQRLSYAEFAERWRFIGIVLAKERGGEPR